MADEAPVGTRGRVCHRWWRRGERPPGLQQIGHLWACIVTAIRPATGEDVTPVLPAVNTAAMQVFRDHVAASRPADAHLVMVLDGAGRLVRRDRVVPPPCSPARNPVERVRLHLRERFLSLRLLHSTDAIIDACRDAWMRLVAEPDRIRSLCSSPSIEKVAS